MWTPPLLVLELLQCCLAGLWLVAGIGALRIALFWDRQSGSERQVKLEKMGEFLQVLIPFTMILTIFSLFLTIFAADTLAPFLTGAMCGFAVFTFTGYGVALLVCKILLALLTGLWLMLNMVDRLTPEQPFVRKKFFCIPLLSLLFFADEIVFFLWLGDMEPDTLVSCCGDLFSSTSAFALPELLNTLEQPLTLWLFLLLLCCHYASGFRVLLRQQALLFFSFSSLLLFLYNILIITLYITQYAFENPVHRCPFCLLQEADAILFWLLYLFSGLVAVCGGGTALLLLRPDLSAARGRVLCRRVVGVTLCCTSSVLVLMGLVVFNSNYMYE